MKRILFILFLVIAINFSIPAGDTMNQRQRHLIENTSGINKRDVPADELLRQKVIIYARMEMIAMKVLIIDLNGRNYNSS